MNTQSDSGGAATGILLAILGVWVLMRTITKDSTGRTLVDHLLGKSPGFSVSGSSAIGASSTVASAGSAAASAIKASTVTGQVTGSALQRAGSRFGWDSSQDAAWNQVIKDESGGNPNATNPTSGAYGIAQMLGSAGHASDVAKYKQYGGDAGSVAGQLEGMAGYIKATYGTPANALAHENADHWY